MRYFPVNLDIRGKPVVIVGGGAVAGRKCLSLLAAGAHVTVVAPALTETLMKCVNRGDVTHIARNYARGDLSGALLVFAATDCSEVNRAVAEEAKESGILADIADGPDLSEFISPALLSRGDLQIAISTGGKSPALAAKIRRELGRMYGREFAELIKILGKVREKLLTGKSPSSYNKRILHALVDQDLPSLLKSGSTSDIDHLLLEICGPGFSLAELGIGEKEEE
ncbi:MAG TPA: bifunctional precorrin-2 dehydrogenase/sirohydrochlorin ferrochelatase [Geobacteraceae bacterium]|nr:bifunctional precorrin-2 dehydrogenase/sirohydrochlorin ferrochelatase [Geobacteraceae bacterium]